MNTFLILIFIASFAGIAILLSKKVIQIEKYGKGDDALPEEAGILALFSENSMTEETWDFSKINEIKNVIAVKGMEYGHEFVLWLLKVWIKAYYFGKKQKKRWYEKAKVMSQRVSKVTHGVPSPITADNKIIKQVANYKSRLIRIAKKMKEQEERKQIEKESEEGL